MVLPTVVLILVFGIQVLTLQTGRVTLISLAAETARAIARGEDKLLVAELMAERAQGLTSSVEYLDLSVCVELTKITKVAGLFELPLTERACARKSGL